MTNPLKVWMYYTTDGDVSYFNIKLFEDQQDCLQYQLDKNDVYSNIAEIEVTPKASETKQPFRYDELLCPDCDGQMVARTGQYGKFWGCKRFPECKGTRDSEGKSKLDRFNEKVENKTKDKEWNRNIQDGISWKK